LTSPSSPNILLIFHNVRKNQIYKFLSKLGFEIEKKEHIKIINFYLFDLKLFDILTLAVLAPHLSQKIMKEIMKISFLSFIKKINKIKSHL